MSRKSRKSALLNVLWPQSKVLPFPFFTLKRESRIFTIGIFSFIKITHSRAWGFVPPFSVVPVPFSIPVSLVLPVPFLEIVIMPIFIMKQVPMPPAALPGPARWPLSGPVSFPIRKILQPHSQGLPHAFPECCVFGVFQYYLNHFSIMGPMSENVSSLRTSLFWKNSNSQMCWDLTNVSGTVLGALHAYLT